MRIKTEDEILNIETRAAIIEEILSPENRARKDEAFKRFRCYKDKTSEFVKNMLLKQFSQKTVDEMSYCMSNISLVKKVINKLARVYDAGVTRTLDNDDDTDKLGKIVRLLSFDDEMKKANRFLKLQKNCALYIRPVPTDDGITLKIEALNPYLYDVVEAYYDRQKPMCFIISNYRQEQAVTSNLNPATRSDKPQLKSNNGKDDIIADDPQDQQNVEWIFWTKSYHFTTNTKGEIISHNGNENPIKMLPFVNLATDQDGSFWAIGGDDLADGAILVNAMITNIQHIAISQGFGQFYLKGKNLPTQIAIGPTKCIKLEYNEGEPVPDIGYASASPDIDKLRSLVEMYVALLLTTNNLSTSGVSTKLEGGVSAPSGVALMLDKAESMEDLAEQKSNFVEYERKAWGIIKAWIDGMQELSALSLPDDVSSSIKIKINEQQIIMSEAEKLANIKARQELGLDTHIDLIMRDDPSLSREQAEEKLLRILEEKMNKLSLAIGEKENGSEENGSIQQPVDDNDQPV